MADDQTGGERSRAARQALGASPVWELRRSTLAFSELRERTGISPSVLSARLDELVEAGVVERDGGRRYRLSGNGPRAGPDSLRPQ